jgi:phage-related protein
MALTVVFFETAAGRSQPRDFLAALPKPERAAIAADIQAVAEHGRAAPVSVKPIRGVRGLLEIRTLGFRTFFVVRRGTTMWVLHACKKQDQRRGIEIAAARLKMLEE